MVAPAIGRGTPAQVKLSTLVMTNDLTLPVQPPIEPMLAEVSRELPAGDGWQYEPKWDGFRALVFWDGRKLFIQSRDLKPLNRYFPELDEGLRRPFYPARLLRRADCDCQ